MSPSPALQHIRPLGIFERFRAILHDLGFHYNVALGAHVTHEAASLDKSRLFSALETVIARLPPLSVTIRGLETDKPYLVQLPEIQLEHLVRWVDCRDLKKSRDSFLDEVLSEENSKGFEVDSLDPLWRVVVLDSAAQDDKEKAGSSGSDVIFVWHHAIGDGHSGLAVLYAILDALNASTSTDSRSSADTEGAAKKSSSSPIVINSSEGPAPALESLLKMPPSLQTRVKRLSATCFGNWSKPPVTKKWSGGVYDNSSPIKTNIRHLRIPTHNVTALLTKCRREKTSVTAFLQTLIGNGLFRHFQYAERLMCATAISLRRFLPPSIGDEMVMGMWVSAFHVDFARSPSFAESWAVDWTSTRKNKERINYEITKGDQDIETGALRDVPDLKRFLLDKVGKERADSFAVTNLGVVKSQGLGREMRTADKKTAWKIEDVVFSQSCHMNGSAIQFCIITTEESDMVISLSSQQGIVPSEDLNAIAERLREDLIKSGGTDEI